MPMTSLAQIHANRLNALKSTGPRSELGKRRSSQNATTHGFYSQVSVIRGESESEFVEFQDAMMSSLAPRGALQVVLASKIVHLAWVLRRLPELQRRVIESLADWSEDDDRFENSNPDHDDCEEQDIPEPLTELAEAFAREKVECGYEKLERHECRLLRAMLGLLKHLKRLQQAADDGATEAVVPVPESRDAIATQK
jgi:hypothetical protein